MRSSRPAGPTALRWARAGMYAQVLCCAAWLADSVLAVAPLLPEGATLAALSVPCLLTLTAVAAPVRLHRATPAVWAV